MKHILLVIFIAVTGMSRAQVDGFPVNDDFFGKHSDSVSDTKALKGALRILREFRIQAFVQAEWQKADSGSHETYGPQGTNYVGSAQGGTFPLYANNRFLIRRGRFKLSFEHKNSKDLKVMDFAFQFDLTEQGLSILKDFYGRLIDPWLGWFSFQGGIFLRPFGFETPTPPAFAESPEFSRVNQTIFPNESELGAAIVIESPAKYDKVYFRADASIVNGDGVGVGYQTGAYQSRKDFIARIKVGKVWDVGRGAKLCLNGSVSYYNGAVMQGTPYVFVATDTGGHWQYVNIGVDSLVDKKIFKREYYGAHLELKADYPLGITTLRGEYIAGQQPGGGAGNSTSVPLGAGNNPPSSDIYIRQFNGAMFYFVQSFKNKLKHHTMMHDITLKYDWYTPLDKVPGKDLNFLYGFSTSDMKYTDIGVGYSFIPYTFFKLMVWYDFIINESTALPYWTSNYKGNNILTIRTQFYVDTWWFNHGNNNYTDNLMLRNY